MSEENSEITDVDNVVDVNNKSTFQNNSIELQDVLKDFQN